MRATVLCALYKSGNYLVSKLQSIRNLKAMQDARFIFLNCMNLDNEKVLVNSFAEEYDNITHVTFNNHIRLYESWNVGIKMSDTEYICTYNADDQWHPNYLVSMMEFLDQHKEYNIVSSGVLITDMPNQVYPDWDRQIGKIPQYAYPKSSAGPCPMWRRSLHAKYGYFGNYRVIGDARFWEAMHAGGERFGLLDKDLVLYLANPNSLERRNDESTGRNLRDLDLEEA